jgi:hypothetical protein
MEGRSLVEEERRIMVDDLRVTRGFDDVEIV